MLVGLRAAAVGSLLCMEAVGRRSEIGVEEGGKGDMVGVEKGIVD